MSAHGGRARAQRAEKMPRAVFDVGHVQFELIDHPDNGATFGLRAKYGPDSRPCLFSGHIEPGMGTQLRRLAHAVDALEPKSGGLA
jgi:hypothetical protein